MPKTRDGTSRHKPTLFAHQENEQEVNVEDEETSQWPHRSFSGSSGSPAPAQSGSYRSSHARPRPSNGSSSHSRPQPNASQTNSSTLYSRHAQNAGRQPPGYDADDGRLNRRSKDDESEDDEFAKEERTRLRSKNRPGFGVGGEPTHERLSAMTQEGETLTPEERERLEWQTMLSSVLDGDVLHSENKRIGRALDSNEALFSTGKMIWLGLRAHLRGRRDPMAELKRIIERRTRSVELLIEEVMSFQVNVDGVPAKSKMFGAMDQVLAILDRVEASQALYQSIKAMRIDKPACAAEGFTDRVDTLVSWCTIVTTIRNQIVTLQKWTGSDLLDVNQPFTSAEVPIRGQRRSTAMGSVASEPTRPVDASTFVERVLKEDSLQQTFKKKALTMMLPLIHSAREFYVTHATTIEEMCLPSFKSDLVQLISFPTKLISAGLRMQLNYARKVSEPSLMVIDQMMEDFKVSLQIACRLKREYELLMIPEGGWNPPPCINSDYDTIILDTLSFFVKLINWKLKSGSLKETETLESQWEILNEVSMSTEGGGLLVSEQLCLLTSRLMIRVSNQFENQILVPLSHQPRAKAHGGKGKSANAGDERGPKHKDMTPDEMLDWYSKMLDTARGRYRKLQRYGRLLAQRFSNSAEYTLEHVNIDSFINTLALTDHFLVYTDRYEEDGVYIIADPALRERHDIISQMLEKTFHAQGRASVAVPDDRLVDGEIGVIDEGVEEEDDGFYLIIMSPSERFMWQGLVLVMQLPKIDFDIEDKHVRLVADGPGIRLTRAKQRFADVLDAEDVVDSNSIVGALECLVEQQAHLPTVNRELRKIERASNKLAEAIVNSAERVRTALSSVPGRHDILENWFMFATDHGQEAQKYMDRAGYSKLNRLLTRLAITWIAFICDDCDPTDRKIFRWAVNALEFAKLQTRGGYILDLPITEFTLLRQKVASCMTLLISHFDILGARSSIEAKKEQERTDNIRRQQRNSPRPEADLTDRPSSPDEASYGPKEGGPRDRSIRIHRQGYMAKIMELEAKRAEIQNEQHSVGRVLSEEKPEDRSLVFLASSQSNISMRWQQGKFIGGGAFGTVYLAHNLDTGHLMAVKEIRFKDASSLSTLYKQVQDELSVMEILQHPNIIEYYGIEVHRDKVYIFEEYCQGGSLATLLENGRIEDETILLLYTLQMLEGLHYLHSNGVIHRDIKPDNILLDHLGVIKYVDFGASKVLAKNRGSIQQRSRAPGPGMQFPGMPGMPNENSLAGTPMYMSPEVIRSDRRGREGAMDVWSLGCVVLECSTGRKPWSNLDNEWAIMFHIGVATKHPPLPEPGQLSKVGIEFVERCLTIDPMLRPTAAELLDDPWIIQFRQEMAEYDEQQSDIPTTPGLTTASLPSFDPELAMHRAGIQEQLEQMAIDAVTPSDISPGETKRLLEA